MPRFAANLTMMFTEHDFPDRFQAASAAGFAAVEYLFPYDWTAADLACRLARAGLEQVLFNMPPGDWAAGERGLACLPGREREFRAGVERAITYAAALGCPRVHAMAGLVPRHLDRAVAEQVYVENIAHAAARCAEVGLDLLIEPINPSDMPGYFLHDFGVALTLIDRIAARGGAAPRLQFDIYHCARIHGDVCGWIGRCAPYIAHYQIAGVPERHEPDRGDLAVADILAAIDAATPGLWVGCEYRPAAGTVEGLDWLRRLGALHRSGRAVRRTL